MFERPVSLGIDLGANRTLEASETFLDDEGTPSFDDDLGEFGLPEWRGRMGIRADVEKLRLTWSVNYLGSVEQDADTVDAFGNVFDAGGDTCLGPDGGDFNCRDVGFADDYFLHSMSVYYYGDVWTFGGGMRNVFNTSPPLVDPDESLEVTSVNNVPVGYGYDLNGRTYFLNIAASFGGER
jgi:iron complex outermembrane receptor protein